jgi:hypothetical protein
MVLDFLGAIGIFAVVRFIYHYHPSALQRAFRKRSMQKQGRDSLAIVNDAIVTIKTDRLRW